MTELVVDLPGGWRDAAGERHRTAVVVPLTGRDEELLAGAPPSAHLVTTLLARCVRRIGGVAVTEEMVRELEVGDRQTLLLGLREATFGPVVTGVVGCPWESCGARMDLDFRTHDIPVRRRSARAPDDPVPGDPVHELVVSEAAAPGADETSRRLRFRLPTGADQEAVGDLLETNPAAAWTALLERCVVALGAEEPPAPGHVAELSSLARAEVEQAMSEAACGPEMTLEATCPECGRGFLLPFEIRDFFFGELRSSPELLVREVHYLAYHYSWSETEILDLPRDRRQRYIEVLAEEIERLNDAVG